MKYLKLFCLILLVFFKTETIFSNENIFNVNNIEIKKEDNINNEAAANKAIKEGFKTLIKRVLLHEDKKKLSNLNFKQIKELVSYYQTKRKENKLIYSIFFDKEKLHKIFYSLGISYSDISDKEIYLLPVLEDRDQLNIFNNNFFYEKWNNFGENNLIEFILPLENIEIIQSINSNKNSIFDIDLRNLFQEYSNKNLSLLVIELNDNSQAKVFLKTKILGKNISKNMLVKKMNNDKISLNEKIIVEAKNELENIIKSQNLIDVRTPSFLNVKLILDSDNDLVELNKRLKKIDSIENIFVQEFNNEYIFLKMKYLGRITKIIKQLENQKILLKEYGSQWSLRII
tara:strand:- start:1228 stop:2256 length:1029 start_codon:yes stop_codon:yes gene_type:complete